MDWKAKCPHSTNQSRKPPESTFLIGTTLCGRYNLKQNVLKDYCQLFSKLFIPCQSRECDLYDFFRHETRPFPAALSDGGKLHACQKSQLAAVLESHVTLPDNEPQADVFITGGSALVNVLPPRTSNTFEDYATLDVLPTIRAYSIKYERTYIVFDVYRSSSLRPKPYQNGGMEPGAG